MMELKVVCNCGQKYKFDVEPVNHRMPFNVQCPVCGLDGTHLADGILSQLPAAAAPPPPPVMAAPSVAAAMAPSRPIQAAAGAAAYQPSTQPKYMQDNPALQNNNFLLGIAGALLGAAVAVGFMVGTHVFFGFSFPMFGTIMGAIIGFGARLFYRGTSSTLGAMAALVAFVTVGATLFLMFGILGILFSLISLVVAVVFAFKIAS
jgi:hypothetical protein